MKRGWRSRPKSDVETSKPPTKVATPLDHGDETCSPTGTWLDETLGSEGAWHHKVPGLEGGMEHGVVEKGPTEAQWRDATRRMGLSEAEARDVAKELASEAIHARIFVKNRPATMSTRIDLALHRLKRIH